MSKAQSGRAYHNAVLALRAEGDAPCWSCGKPLYADAKYPHPNSITLGHYTAIEDGGSLLDRNNYGPQCITCNMGDGARRTHRILRARTARQRGEVFTDNNF